METQNNAYQTNDMAELKREALAKLDLELLKSIRSYEQRCATMRLYYVREGETDILDKGGNTVAPETLGIDLHWIDFHFLPIYYAWVLADMPDKPEDLFHDVTRKPGDILYPPVRILEVPAGTAFPLPEDFSWSKACKDYRDNGLYVNRHDHNRLECHGPGYDAPRHMKPIIVPGSKQAYESEHIKG